MNKIMKIRQNPFPELEKSHESRILVIRRSFIRDLLDARHPCAPPEERHIAKVGNVTRLVSHGKRPEWRRKINLWMCIILHSGALLSYDAEDCTPISRSEVP
jgi:hypothetical protein